jgi:hypothetical protein
MKKKLRRRLLYVVGALVLAAVALVAAVPLLIDTPAVRAEIQRRLSAAVQGEVAWQRLGVALLPAPHVELREVRIEIPARAQIGVEQVDVYVRLWPLLLGRPEIASLALRRPRIELSGDRGGETTPAPERKALDAVALYRAIAEPAAQALRRFAPDTTVELSDAALELRIPDAPASARTLSLSGLRAKAVSGEKRLDLQLETASNLWKRLRLDARIDYADLSAEARIALDALAVERDIPPATLRATLRTDARTSVECELDGALGTLAPAVKARLELPLGKPASLTAQLGEVDLPQVWTLARARLPALERLGPLEGKLSANARVVLADSWQAEIGIVKSSATLALPQLPAPVALTGGAVRIDAGALRLDKVALGVLDAKTAVSGTIALREVKVELAAADGVAGDKLVAWALALAGAPKALEAKTPVRFAARRVAWSAKGGLVLEAQLAVDGGPQIGVDLGWTPRRLELRRLTLKDAQTDATLSAVVGGGPFQAGFSGVLYNQSLAAMRKQPEPRPGRVQGEMRLTLDQARPLRSKAEGKLKVEGLDLSVLAGRPVLIEHVDLTAAGEVLRIDAARVVIAEQAFAASGEIRRTERGAVIDARLESPGVVVERLLPPEKPAAAPREPAKVWPLPVTGRIAVRAGFVQFPQHRIAPLEGNLVLEPERARLSVAAAKMCGASFPLQAEANPAGFDVAAQLAMQNEPFDDAIRCLTGGTVLISGAADLRADLHTNGRSRDDYIRNLTGNLEAQLQKGRVERFALIGNIVSILNLNVASARDAGSSGFAYRSISAKGRFADGAFLVEESFFDSDAVRLGASGRVDLLGKSSQLNVLVGLLTRVDRVAGAIPLFGYVVGGSLTAVPVTVTGDIRDPRVVPLGPSAVSDHLLGIFERALKVPGKLVPGKEPAPGAGAASGPASAPASAPEPR